MSIPSKVASSPASSSSPESLSSSSTSSSHLSSTPTQNAQKASIISVDDGKHRYGFISSGTSNKAGSIAVIPFASLSGLKKFAYRLSTRHTLTKIDGQKVLINLKSFEKRTTVSKSVLIGTTKINRYANDGSEHIEGFSKSELTEKLLKLATSDPRATSEKVDALQVRVQSRRNHLSSKSFTYKIIQQDPTKKKLRVDTLHYIASGGFGRVWRTADQNVVKVSIESDEYHTQLAEKEVQLARTVHSRLEENRIPPIGIGGKPISVMSLQKNAQTTAVAYSMPEIKTGLDQKIEDKYLKENELLDIESQIFESNPDIERIQNHAELQKIKEDNLFAMFQLLTGMAALEAVGIAHRDIKPENIRFDGDKAYMIDFGLSDDTRNDESIIRSKGSPVFMNQRDLRLSQGLENDEKPLTVSSDEGADLLSKMDTFAMGATFCEMINLGQPPYKYKSDEYKQSWPDFNRPVKLDPMVKTLYGEEVAKLLEDMTTEYAEFRPTPLQALERFMKIAETNPSLMSRIAKLKAEQK